MIDLGETSANLVGVFSLASDLLTAYSEGLLSLTPILCFAMLLFGWIREEGEYGFVRFSSYMTKN